MITCSSDHLIKIWDSKTLKKISILKHHKNWVYSISFSPCGNYLISSSEDNSTIIWDYKTYSFLKMIKDSTEVYTSCFSSDGKRILTGGEDKMIKIWDMYTLAETKRFLAHEQPIRLIIFSPDN